MLKRCCDSCGDILSHSDDLVRDYIDNRSDCDLCENCYLDAELISIAAKQDLLAKRKPGTTIKKMLDNYKEQPG